MEEQKGKHYYHSPFMKFVTAAGSSGDMDMSKAKS